MSSNISHVVIIVLGDVGRSPRMQYHAEMFSSQKSISRVTFIGYKGERSIKSLEESDKVVFKTFELLDLNALFEKFFGLYIAKKLNFLRVVVKGIFCLLSLIFYLLIIPKYEVVLIQNPPCIPALISTLVVSLFRWNSIWVDWHNLGFTMFKYDSNIARFSKLLERNLAKFCSVHFCVSNVLGEWLLKEFNISAKVLYDRPSKRFDKSQISIQSRHELLLKLNLIDSELFKSDLSDSSTSFKEGSYTIQTYTDKNGQTLMREDSTRILFSSTSWTEDEDFHLLLKALSKLDKILRANLNKYGPNKYQSSKVLIVITGKGPLKEAFLNEYNQIAPNLKMVAVVTPWLEPDEYPKIIKCSDIGICLHGSTSGLDLPMKVLDMLGSGLPAICLNYPAIKELVTDKEDGYLFKQNVLSDENYLTQLNIDTIDSEFNSFPELFDCLVKVLCLSKSQSTLSSLRKNVQIKPLSSWESTWNSVIYPLINKEKEVKEEKDD